MRSSLYPSIESIEQDLFGRSERHLASDKLTVDDGGDGGDGAVTMPPFLAELVERRVQAQTAYPNGPLAVGQIRILSNIPSAEDDTRALRKVFGVLLSCHVAGNQWRGWVVAQEADYATDKDVLLEEGDGPVSPEAVMVQAWNAVEIRLTGEEPIAATLSANRLATITGVADENMLASGEFIPPRPGHIGLRNAPDGATVLTGTPVGEPDDPRHAYRNLYAALAAEVTAAAQRRIDVKQSAQSWFAQLLRMMTEAFVRPAWTLALVFGLVAQSSWIYLRQDVESGTVYRSSTQPARDRCADRIHVQFKPDTPYADVVLLVRRLDAAVVDGPSETGEIWILVPTPMKSSEALSALRASSWVESADVVAVKDPECCR